MTTEDPDEVLVSWRDCNCEWSTKYCDEDHVKHASVSRRVLEDLIQEQR